MAVTAGDKRIGYLTPNDADESDKICRSFSIPNDPQWLGNFMGALMPLSDEKQWIEFGNVTPEDAALYYQNIIDDAYDNAGECGNEVPAPYWDDAEDNEVELPEDDQTWYGTVTDALAPIDELNFEQNIAVWLLTGFVAYAAGVGAAIFFRTTARRFVIAVEAGEIAEIIRVVVDSAEFRIDTTGHEGEIIRRSVYADPDLEEHDIYVIKVGDA